jgi:serralysin
MATWYGTHQNDEYIHFRDEYFKTIDSDPNHESLIAFGLNGDDFIVGANGYDTIYGEDGNDELQGNSPYRDYNQDNDTLVGGKGDDRLFGFGGGDVLEGGQGFDTIYGGYDNDLLYGGTEDDFLSGEFGDDRLEGEDGNDRLEGGWGDDQLFAGAGADVLLGEDGNDILTADGSFAHGADLLYGDDGHDVYRITGNVNFVVSDSAGHDRLEIPISYTLTDNAGIEDLTLTGTAAINGSGNHGNNTLHGNEAANVLYGMGGDDALYGFGGNDILVGGSSDVQAGGADTLYGGDGDDTYYVRDYQDSAYEWDGQGVDTVYSSVDFVLGPAGAMENLVLEGTAVIGAGNALRNTITGNASANTLSGGLGYDTLIGGQGNDSYVLGDVSTVITPGRLFAGFRDYDAVVETPDGGADTIYVARQDGGLLGPITNYTLGANIENGVVGGTGAFDLFGNTLDNNLQGNAAANTLVGGDGNDSLAGRAGFDTLIGEAGDDVYILHDVTSGSYDAVLEAENWGIDTVHVMYQSGGPTSYTLGANLENGFIDGTTGGGDFVLVGAGFQLNGNGLNNNLTGNADSNALNGQFGNDSLTGGAGADSFVFDTTLDAAANVDVVSDFTVDNDIFRLDDAVFTGLATGTLAAGAFHIGTAAADAEDRIIYDNVTGTLSFDSNGDAEGGMTQFAVVSAGLSLTNEDFVIV